MLKAQLEKNCRDFQLLTQFTNRSTGTDWDLKGFVGLEFGQMKPNLAMKRAAHFFWQFRNLIGHGGMWEKAEENVEGIWRLD
jgi:hypothetical protein